MTTLKFTSVDEIPRIVARARAEFEKRTAYPIAFRQQQLAQLIKLIQDNRKTLVDAAMQDLRKPAAELNLTELDMTISEATEAMEDLPSWVKPVKPSVSPVFALDGAKILHDPLGVVLVIGAWNYPFQLTLLPLIGAIAAGNAAILKPSEVSPSCAQALADLLPRYLHPDLYQVVNGAVKETTALLEIKFDHVIYTGNGVVGRIVMAAASKHLCPVTLELGGKSPCVIDKNVDLATVARRVAWGRFMNNGQTCIAPDYVLIHRSQIAPLVEGIKAAVKEYYSENPKTSASWSRIVNINHFKRLQGYLQNTGGTVISLGGEADEADLYLPPTLVVEPKIDSAVMTNEIFGPILPIVAVENIDEAIAFINKRDKPLALYAFSNTQSVIDRIAAQTSSGGFVGNDTLMHASVPELPFGGVGCAGMGAYHGKRSFDLFTHHKAVMMKAPGLEVANLVRYPPYSDTKSGLISSLLFKKPSNFKIPFKKIVILLFVGLVIQRINTVTPGFWEGLAAFFGLRS